VTSQTTIQRAEANLLFNVIFQSQHLPQAAILERMKEAAAQLKAIMPTARAREWVSYAELEARGGNTNSEIYQSGAVYNLEAGVLDEYQAEFVAKMSFYSKKELRFLTTKQRNFLEKCASVRVPEPVVVPTVAPLSRAATANAARAQVMRNAHALAKQYRQSRPDATYVQLLRETLQIAWSEINATKALRAEETVSLRLAA
jgi:hypothetical protein